MKQRFVFSYTLEIPAQHKKQPSQHSENPRLFPPYFQTTWMMTQAPENQRTRRMEINVKHPDELTTDFTSLPSDHSRPSTTGIPSAFPTACEMPRVTSIHSNKNVHVRHSKSRSK